MAIHPGKPRSELRGGRNGCPYAGCRVTILGMARQGMASARFFLAAGAQVTVSDLRTDDLLATARAELERYVAALTASTATRPVLRFVLGGHPPSLLDETDLLCLSGGVSPAIPIVRTAVARGVPLTNDGLLTLQHCPAPIVGITGSAGKTTTTTLVGLMLEAAGFSVHVGGNIGTPLLDRLDTVQAGDKVVMELSSFQLELFGRANLPRSDRSPAIAAILNVTPNHLDRHPSMSHYAAAKANIVRHQGPGDVCVLSADNDTTGPWLASGRCQISEGEGQAAVYFPLLGTRLGFSAAGEVSAGAFLAGNSSAEPTCRAAPEPTWRAAAQETYRAASAQPLCRDSVQAGPFTGPKGLGYDSSRQLVWRRPGLPDAPVCRAHEVRLRGRHNLTNVLAAICLAGAAGADATAMAQVIATFGGVEHRLEIVRKLRGVLWVDDSIATAPERTIAALRSFAEPIVLLAGGRDKQLPWDGCASVIHERARHVVLFGEAAGLIGDALARQRRDTAQCADGWDGEAQTRLSVTRCSELAEAVAAAAAIALPGDVVLLAPGGTSFDAYVDFEARGRHFRALVEALP